MKTLHIIFIVVAALLVAGCHDRATSELGMAAADGKLERVRQLVESGANINGCSGYEGCEKPLEAAATYGQLDVVKFLVEHGAEINVTDSTNAVYRSARFGKVEVVRYLLGQGGRLVCDRAALESLKRDMAAAGLTALEEEIQKTWVERR
jgi:hypothetical protein